jgi:hypothetical protein
MPVTLPRCSRGGGGPSRRGGRDGGRGRGGRGGPLPCRERNPMLVSNSRNSTLAASISPLPRTPAPSAAVHPPRPAVAGPQYTTSVAASAHGSAPDLVGGPALSSTSRSTAADAITKTALMMDILSKSDSSKNNHAYSLDAIKEMVWCTPTWAKK